MANSGAVLQSLAGAPISWGVCEVPGWGLQLDPARVLAEMSSLGIVATELGPTGYLGDDPVAVAAVAAAHHLRVVGGFVPLVLHDASARAQLVSDAEQSAKVLAGVGADVFVTAVVVDAGWSPRVPLDAAGWRTMFEGFAIVDEICAAHGITQVLHPHVGTLVETADDVVRVLDGSDVRWCLDTGHLSIGGTDPVAFARANSSRVAHVHLKDVRASIADRLNAGQVSLFDATREGIFSSLGDGDVPIAAVLEVLEEAGYDGWYVLEQDVAITGAEPAVGGGPIDAVRVSIDYLKSLSGS